VSGGEKGYVQFRYEWEPAPLPSTPLLDELCRWRDRLHRHGLVGVYPDGIGFGNLSCRSGGDRFVITGTGTGHLPTLRTEHLTEVVAYDLAGNHLTCRGPVVASSESLSHAAVYRSDPAVAAVIHVHHLTLWERLRQRIPTTDPAAEAGTPAMARAIEQLFLETDLRAIGLVAMGGHREGVIGFGGTLDEAGSRILAALEELPESGDGRGR
jgi:L-ribulose-5-phosphate 4-epimerase